MRPQKPKNRANNISREQNNRLQGYYLDDLSCKFCANYRGKKRGCKLSACDFEDEKLDAIKHNRIKRRVGDAV